MRKACRQTLVCAGSVIIPAAMFFASACSSMPKGIHERRVVINEGEPGSYTIDTTRTTATVKSLDAATRMVTVVGEDGKERTIKAGPTITGFDKIQVGDKIVTTVSEETLIFMADKKLPLADGTRTLTARSRENDKPYLLTMGVSQMTATVVGLDRRNRTALLRLPDGKTKQVPVRQDIDLSKYSVGEEVVFRCTEATLLSVEKP